MQNIIYMWLFAIGCIALSGVILLIIVCGTEEYRKTMKISSAMKKVLWQLPKEIEDIAVGDMFFLFIHSVLLTVEILRGLSFLFISDVSVVNDVNSVIVVVAEIFLGMTILYMLWVSFRVTATKTGKSSIKKELLENIVIRYRHNELIDRILITKTPHITSKGIVLLIPLGWGVDTEGYILNAKGKRVVTIQYDKKQHICIGDYNTLSQKLVEIGYTVVRIQFLTGKKFNENAGVSVFIEELKRVYVDINKKGTEKLFLVGHSIYGGTLANILANIIPNQGVGIIGGSIKGVREGEAIYAEQMGTCIEAKQKCKLLKELYEYDKKKIKENLEKYQGRFLRIIAEFGSFGKCEDEYEEMQSLQNKNKCIVKIRMREFMTNEEETSRSISPSIILECGRSLGVKEEIILNLVNWMENN